MPDGEHILSEGGLGAGDNEVVEVPILQDVFRVLLDDRWRTVIPAKCYKQLGEVTEVVAGPAPDGASLHMFAVPAWRDWVRLLRQAKLNGDPDAGWMLRLYTSLYSRRPVQREKHRVVLGETLAAIAGVGPGDTVCIAGKADRLHLLSEQRWQEAQATVLDKVRQIPEDSPYNM
jgi:DNA-binding transcriptional regulator/RsmH inhibitor MraZ